MKLRVGCGCTYIACTILMIGLIYAGNAVVNVYINREKNFAFVEFRTGNFSHYLRL